MLLRDTGRAGARFRRHAGNRALHRRARSGRGGARGVVGSPEISDGALESRGPKGRSRASRAGRLMTIPREYPDAPRAAVGAVVLEGDRVLLVRRGTPPAQGRWSIPGGLIHLGETLEDAVIREVEEESGLRVELLGLCGVIDRIIPGEAAKEASPAGVRYHFVI